VRWTIQVLFEVIAFAAIKTTILVIAGKITTTVSVLNITRSHVTCVRKGTAIAVIPIAPLIPTTAVAMTVAIVMKRTRTSVATFWKIATIAEIKLALLIEAAAVAITVAQPGSRTE
jgi:hypothetical protein